MPVLIGLVFRVGPVAAPTLQPAAQAAWTSAQVEEDWLVQASRPFLLEPPAAKP